MPTEKSFFLTRQYSSVVDGEEADGFKQAAREAKQRDVVFRISPQVYAEVSGETAIDGYESSDLAVDEVIARRLAESHRKPILFDIGSLEDHGSVTEIHRNCQRSARRYRGKS